jgi:hypothetical protein
VAPIELDLDAALAARREVEQEPKAFKLGGKRFELPFELPNKVTEFWRIGEIVQGLQVLLGEQWEDFDALLPSTVTMQKLLEGIVEGYGFADMGESEGSGNSSTNGSKRSKRTS